MNKKKSNQEKVLDEIRQRVLEESENLKAEKEKLLEEKLTIEALQEITDLPIERIEEISEEVKNKHDKERKLKKKHMSNIIIGVIVSCIIGFIIVTGIINGIKNHQENLRKQAIRKAEEKYSRLISAVESGNLEMVKYHVLEEGIPVELEGYEYDTALMKAVKEMHTDIITFLLEQKADVLKKNSEGKSVMDLADEGSNLVVKKTVSTALVNTTPEESPIRKLQSNGHYYSETAFLKLLDKKDKEGLSLFLAADEGPYSHTYDDKGIRLAAKKGYKDIITLLYEKGHNINPDIKNLALLDASLEGHLEIIDFLLIQGADINFKYDLSHYAFEQNFTPLLCALAEDNAAVEHLLKKGANPNLVGSSDDLVPLMVPMYYVDNSIISESRLKQIRLLIKYGADVNKVAGNGATPLEYAQTLRPDERRPISRVLIDAGAEIPMTEDFFRELVFMNDLPHVKEFLEYGMDPDLQGFEYYDNETTALIKSVMLQNYDMVKMLIEYGADVNYETPDYGKTTLLMAVINEDLSMVRLLLKNRARVTKAVLDRIEEYYTWSNDTRDKIRSLINSHR